MAEPNAVIHKNVGTVRATIAEKLRHPPQLIQVNRGPVTVKNSDNTAQVPAPPMPVRLNPLTMLNVGILTGPGMNLPTSPICEKFCSISALRAPNPCKQVLCYQ